MGVSERFQIQYSLWNNCRLTLTHVKQVLLGALFGCCCHALGHTFRLCLEGCEHLGVDLLRIHVCGHVSCFRCLTFTLRQTAYIEWSYSGQPENQSYLMKMLHILVAGDTAFLTLLYEYGLSFISPALRTVAPLVICLIDQTWAYLITHSHTVINKLLNWRVEKNSL